VLTALPGRRIIFEGEKRPEKLRAAAAEKKQLSERPRQKQRKKQMPIYSGKLKQIYKKEKERLEKLVQKTTQIRNKVSFSAPADDWKCHLCFSSWFAWQRVKELKELVWLQGNCNHAFCPMCANQKLVEEHEKHCTL
jgi:hypothetical protein